MKFRSRNLQPVAANEGPIMGPAGTKSLVQLTSEPGANATVDVALDDKQLQQLGCVSACPTNVSDHVLHLLESRRFVAVELHIAERIRVLRRIVASGMQCVVLCANRDWAREAVSDSAQVVTPGDISELAESVSTLVVTDVHDIHPKKLGSVLRLAQRAVVLGHMTAGVKAALAECQGAFSRVLRNPLQNHFANVVHCVQVVPSALRPFALLSALLRRPPPAVVLTATKGESDEVRRVLADANIARVSVFAATSFPRNEGFVQHVINYTMPTSAAVLADRTVWFPSSRPWLCIITSFLAPRALPACDGRKLCRDSHASTPPCLGV